MLFFTSEILHNFLIFIAIGMVVKFFLRGIFRKILVHELFWKDEITSSIWLYVYVLIN